MKILARLLAAWLALSPFPALADNSFVAPTATGTAATGQIPGTTTNDSPCATCVGAIVDSGAVGTTTSLVSGTSLNCTSISVTAGDWDVSGVVGFTGNSSTTVQGLAAGISTTTGTLPSNSTIGIQQIAYGAAFTAFATRNPQVSAGPVQILVNTTTPVFLVGRADFSVSTATLSGCQLIARRRR